MSIYLPQDAGGIAQLVERLHGMQEVSGSRPLTSTKKGEIMKKILLSLLLLSAGSVMAYTGTCNGGSPVTGKVNGHVYCISAAKMNWWSALAWCQSQNSQLADFSIVCPNSTISSAAGSCPNMQGVGITDYGWTSSPSGGSDAVNLQFSNGAVYTGYHQRHEVTGHAICE